MVVLPEWSLICKYFSNKTQVESKPSQISSICISFLFWKCWFSISSTLSSAFGLRWLSLPCTSNISVARGVFSLAAWSLLPYHLYPNLHPCVLMNRINQEFSSTAIPNAPGSLNASDIPRSTTAFISSPIICLKQSSIFTDRYKERFSSPGNMNLHLRL